MCVGHAVHAVCHPCQAHNSKLQEHHMHYAPTAPLNTLLVDTTALLKTQHAKVVEERDTGEQNAAALTPLVLQVVLSPTPVQKVAKRGENHKLPKPKHRKDPCRKIFIVAMDCRTVGDMHPKEMIINNISSQWCNEAYTVLKTACKHQQ